MRPAFGMALAAGLLGCASLPQTEPAPPCRVQGATLHLAGFTGPEMLDCIGQADLTDISAVVLDSTGGPVATALLIAERLALLEADMVVRRRCHSSCANYILPVARRIRLEPGAVVILHGSVDGQAVARGASPQLHDAQMAFARRHDIPLGWLLYRAPEDATAGYGRHLSGQARTWPEDQGQARIAFIAVEEAMMRSCLTAVEIVPFIDTGVQRVYARSTLREAWRRGDTYPSGSLACRPSETAEPAAPGA